jgi:bifunctional UDP-N-acetylglucosamine pyrophosphorylase/glucosamine-1-phosphate N-acetyltransferase
MIRNIAVVILAAGKSTRMKSAIPKVLHKICGRPMLCYVSDLVASLKANKVVYVLGFKHEEVKKLLRPPAQVAIQKKLDGTASAVKVALRCLDNFKGTLLVLYGDNPLLKKETIDKLLKYHAGNNADATLLTAVVEKPAGYGRVLRDKYSSISGIVEEKDADDFQKGIKEINTGIMCFNIEKLAVALRQVKPDNLKKEYYLTDVIGILYKNGALIDNVRILESDEALGINSRIELAKANQIMQRRINEELMKSGVSIVDPRTSFIDFGAKIGQDTTIYPFTVIESDVKIGKRCSVGPFAHLRGGTRLQDDVLAGNFLEIVRSKIGKKTLAKHFCYLGDSRIGNRVNVGAGTVTANFDGKKKNITVIRDGAFIGSDTVFVAPVKIGRFSRTGAGSVVLKDEDVPGGVTVVGVPARPKKR